MTSEDSVPKTTASGEMDLAIMLENSRPIVNPGEYFFVPIDDETLNKLPRSATLFEFKEHRSPKKPHEGTTIIIERSEAEKHGIKPKDDYVAAWLTLEVQSSLEAVGLTAVFAKALGDAGVSANVVAAYYHDHIFVGVEDKEKAEKVLLELAEENR